MPVAAAGLSSPVFACASVGRCLLFFQALI
jgi:hypothetical protein